MGKNRQIKSKWLARQFLQEFKSKPHWPAKEICEKVKTTFKILITRELAYEVKYFAAQMLHGSMTEHYDVNPDPKEFKRLFICYDALKRGWLLRCRKLLCVDACFLKTFLGGQLISAIGRDGNEQICPVAWAVVEGENNDSYDWFFEQLKTTLGEEIGEGWTFISDEHNSIVATLAKQFPKAEHRHSARHVFANWHKSFKGDDMKMLFWGCAKAYNESDFELALEEQKKDPRAAEAFLRCRHELFCRAFIGTTTKNDVIVNNMAETFNSYIIEARAKHIIYSLEDIRTLLMQRMLEKKTSMIASTHVVCPRVQETLEEEKDKAAECVVVPSSETVFQVSRGIQNMIVDLVARTCTCRKWDLTSIPCCHSIAAMYHIGVDVEKYVYDLYKREAYLLTYELPIAPVTSQQFWPKVTLNLTPPIKVCPGRPRKKRRRDPHEDPKRPGKLTRHGLGMTCSMCKSFDHNKRTCPQKDNPNTVPPPPKKPMGRPRTATTGAARGRRRGTGFVNHHAATAEPARVGRGGRVVKTGRGKGSGRGKGKQSGKGRGRTPQGFGVLFDQSGNAYPTNMASTSGQRS